MTALTFDGKCSVKAVVDNVHAGMRELCANLMRYAGADNNLEEGSLFAFPTGVSDG